MNKKVILIVDDDKGILEALSFMLTSEGYKVITDAGVDIFKKIKKYNPSVIMLDALLNGADGRQICKKIKKNKSLKYILVILFSAHPTVATTYKEYGADIFLPKPFDNDTLLAIINKLG